MNVETKEQVVPMDSINNPDPGDLLPGTPPSSLPGLGPGPLSSLPTISWSHLIAGTRLSDGDAITASVTPTAGNQLQLALKTGHAVTWWKGIEVIDQNNQKIAFAYTQDQNHGPACTTVTLSGVDGQLARVEFQKAKVFGVHTGMYQIGPDALNNGKLSGVLITFNWTAD